MSCFRLLHISDCHVAATPNVFGWPDSQLSQHFPDHSFRPLSPSSWDDSIGDCLAFHQVAPCNQLLNALLLTGDLVTSGSPDDFAEADKFVRRLEKALSAPDRTGYRPNPLPSLLMMPGNHDRFSRWSNRPGNERFDETFPKYWSPPERLKWWQRLYAWIPFLRPARSRVQSTLLQNPDGEQLALVAADFTLRHLNEQRYSKTAYMGQGKVHLDVLADLKAETSRLSMLTNPPAVVWIIHFAPRFPGLNAVLELLDEHDSLQTAAHELKVEHIFCGHTHEALEYPLSSGTNRLTVYCAGTATQSVSEKGCTCHPLEIDVHGHRIDDIRWYTLVWNGEEFRVKSAAESKPPTGRWPWLYQFKPRS